MRGLPVLLLIVPLLAGCSAPTSQDVLGTPAPTHPLSASSFSWEPHVPTVGEPVVFTPHVRSSAPGDEVLGLRWDLGGTTSAERQPMHVFRVAGEHQVHLTIQTRDGGRYTVDDTVEVLTADGSPAPPPPSDPSGPSGPGGDGGVAPPAISVEVDENAVRFSFAFGAAVESVHWDFGDGTESTEPAPEHTYLAAGDYEVALRVLSPAGIHTATHALTIESVPFLPHVVVAVPDTGINPYHEAFRRPGLTAHPCTYVEGFPCDIPALNLTLDAPSWQEAFQADKAKWEAIKPGDWYWIPRTVFVAVHCHSVFAPDDGDLCILDDSHMHGTGTVSSVLSENPDALIAFKEYDPDVTTFRARGIPVDVYSVSWGPSMPVVGQVGWTPALPAGLCPWTVPDDVLYVKSSGNAPGLTVLADCWSGHPDLISVGGAYASDDSQEPLAYKDMDVVSYYCRPTAQTRSLDATRDSYCGTSFAAPTVAGALSKVVLGLRRESGYTGTVENGVVDPILGVTVQDLRDAMERTASYDPESEYPNGCFYCPPANPVAPWLQWGWGFYDGRIADATLAHLLGDPAPDMPAEARTYLEAQYQVRRTLYG